MIPKTIHFVWLSGDELDAYTKRCIASWKKILPEYTIRQWSFKDIPMDQMPAFVHEAISVRKWAFATDYIRLWLVHQYGGIYMDGDVLVRRPFDDFLKHSFFSAVEVPDPITADFLPEVDEDRRLIVDHPTHGIEIQAAIFGAVPGHPFLKDCMSYYDDQHYLDENGLCQEEYIAPDIYAYIASRYGFRYENRRQILAHDMGIYTTYDLCNYIYSIKGDPYAVHCCNGNWRGSGNNKTNRIRKMLSFAVRSLTMFFASHRNPVSMICYRIVCGFQKLYWRISKRI